MKSMYKQYNYRRVRVGDLRLGVSMQIIRDICPRYPMLKCMYNDCKPPGYRIERCVSQNCRFFGGMNRLGACF